MGPPRMQSSAFKAKQIGADSNIKHWLVECCAATFNRYRVGSDRATPYNSVKDEQVAYHLTKKATASNDTVEPA